jgi:hypothetical protein
MIVDLTHSSFLYFILSLVPFLIAFDCQNNIPVHSGDNLELVSQELA